MVLNSVNGHLTLQIFFVLCISSPISLQDDSCIDSRLVFQLNSSCYFKLQLLTLFLSNKLSINCDTATDIQLKLLFLTF